MKKRILVVDDDPLISRALMRGLTATEKYEVQELDDPTKAVEVARVFRPDLILLDVMMPELDGMTVAAQIEEDSELGTTPVLFQTSLLAPDDVRLKGLHLNFPFLAKSSVSEMVQDVDKYIEMLSNSAQSASIPDEAQT